DPAARCEAMKALSAMSAGRALTRTHNATRWVTTGLRASRQSPLGIPVARAAGRLVTARLLDSAVARSGVPAASRSGDRNATIENQWRSVRRSGTGDRRWDVRITWQRGRGVTIRVNERRSVRTLD